MSDVTTNRSRFDGNSDQGLSPEPGALSGRHQQPPVDVPPRIQPGIVLLGESYHYAVELNRDVMDFAVEIESLRYAGLTRSDCRWLICRGYVEHLQESRQLTQSGRQLRRTSSLTLTKQSCFVLTQSGLEVAERFCRELAFRGPSAAGQQPQLPVWLPQNKWDASSAAQLSDFRRTGLPASMIGRGGQIRTDQPRWDCNLHELWLGESLIKVFKLPSPNQEAVLMAFEEDGWPSRIDDPLPPVAGLVTKRRLRDTIKSLNRRQKNRLIRFKGDGTGEGVCWQLMTPALDR